MADYYAKNDETNLIYAFGVCVRFSLVRDNVVALPGRWRRKKESLWFMATDFHDENFLGHQTVLMMNLFVFTAFLPSMLSLEDAEQIGTIENHLWLLNLCSWVKKWDLNNF